MKQGERVNQYREFPIKAYGFIWIANPALDVPFSLPLGGIDGSCIGFLLFDKTADRECHIQPLEGLTYGVTSL